MNSEKLMELKNIARQMRVDCTNMFYKWGSGHFGGSFSHVEVTAVLYFYIMNVRPEEPDWPDRDRFILSKGHGAGTLFSAMAQKGFFPKEWMDQYGDLCANLNAHPSKDRIPGADLSTGSLGHGLPVGAGMAYAAKMDNKDFMTYVLMGDGECGEGMIWETALAAPLYKLDNLVGIIDRNRLCIAGDTEKFLPLEPLAEKWKAFNWDVYDVDGHDIEVLADTFTKIKEDKNGRPKLVIANTVKGKGVDFMENDKAWHAHKMDEALYKEAMRQIMAD